MKQPKWTRTLGLMAAMGLAGGGMTLMANPAAARPEAKPVPAAAGEENSTTAVVAGNTALALDLYGQLQAQRKGNLFFSPYSISSALAMTWAGARGETADQMAKTLHFTLPQATFHPACAGLLNQTASTQVPGQFELVVANSLWPQQGRPFKPEFMAICQNRYGAGVEPVDYIKATEAARQRINGWVEEKTRKKIRELLQPGTLNEMTRMVLVNAIYFKGKWAWPFQKESTTPDANFQVAPAKWVKVPMMHSGGRRRIAQTPDLQMLEMPYQGDSVSMLVLLPRKRGGLPALEQSLTPENLQKWMAAIKQEELVIVSLPKFKIEAEFQLGKTLADMGMANAFDQQKADFSAMAEAPDMGGPLYISGVIHKAIVEVDEEGTVAAAATAVIMAPGCAGPRERPKPIIFCADHPFLVIIRDNVTGSILFLGRVADPTKTTS